MLEPLRKPAEAGVHRCARERYGLIMGNPVRENSGDFARLLPATRREALFKLARWARLRSERIGHQMSRMSGYCRILGQAVGLSDPCIESLVAAAPLHDVGKIAIPDAILFKPDSLDENEWRIVRRHAAIGALLLSGTPISEFRMACRMALTHHERWDGLGYPRGLRAEEIPVEGRICAIADALDAIVSPRPYRAARTTAQALADIASEKGRQFDPQMIEALLAHFQQLKTIPIAAAN